MWALTRRRVVARVRRAAFSRGEVLSGLCRMQLRILNLIAAIAAGVFASAAHASETPPSRAPLVAVGESFTTVEGGPDLWRLSQAIRPHDELRALGRRRS